MGPNIYLIEKVSEAHRQELLREAERDRLMAQLPGMYTTFIRHGVSYHIRTPLRLLHPSLFPTQLGL